MQININYSLSTIVVLVVVGIFLFASPFGRAQLPLEVQGVSHAIYKVIFPSSAFDSYENDVESELEYLTGQTNRMEGQHTRYETGSEAEKALVYSSFDDIPGPEYVEQTSLASLVTYAPKVKGEEYEPLKATTEEYLNAYIEASRIYYELYDAPTAELHTQLGEALTVLDEKEIALQATLEE